VRHQVKIDALFDQRVADAKVVFDGVERLEDLRFEPRFFEHLTQCGLLRCLPLGDRAFGQTPARAAAGGDQRDVRQTVAESDHGAARRVLVTHFPLRPGHRRAL